MLTWEEHARSHSLAAVYERGALVLATGQSNRGSGSNSGSGGKKTATTTVPTG